MAHPLKRIVRELHAQGALLYDPCRPFPATLQYWISLSLGASVLPSRALASEVLGKPAPLLGRLSHEELHLSIGDRNHHRARHESGSGWSQCLQFLAQ